MQKWRWTRRIRLSFSRLFRPKDKEWRYEHIGTHGEESCCQRRLNWRKLRGAKTKTTHFCVSIALIPYNNKDLNYIYCREDFLHYQYNLIGYSKFWLYLSCYQIRLDWKSYLFLLVNLSDGVKKKLHEHNLTIY